MYKAPDTPHNLSFTGFDAHKMADTCNGCGICSHDCAFLQTHGNPGTIVQQYQFYPEKWQAIFFECSLCGLCTSVCPRNFNPAAVFLDFRREAVKNKQVDFSDHQRLLNYEKKGMSKRYSFYSLPEKCSTVFFPGCSLTGTRPKITLKTYEYLKKQDHTTGIVLDCCTKPSHDLGRHGYFKTQFSEMKSILIKHNIKTIIVACPSCYKIFNTYGKEFKVETIYDVMARCGLDDSTIFSGSVTIHDPCQVRFESRVQDSVRSVITARGLDIIDTDHKKNNTFCCGEGGGAACISPWSAAAWTKKGVREAHPHKIVSYCAACVNRLGKRAASFHVLDLAFDPEKTMSGKADVSRAPFTFLNRQKIKLLLKRLPAKIIRERTFTAPEKKKNGLVLKLLIAVLIIAAIARI